ncbi:MAG TPA: hypothetical protein VH597_13280 [Verrucomicrobiae bacterium]|jgi:hypothetical protein|nr:hypothetical protein [Verrucomicrobiae bacterium]
MNEHDESENTAPPIISTPAEPARPEQKPFSYWAKHFLVCNPFYLVSAALLLFGMYRISVDRNLFTEEISQLAFNLGSLEFYEILLVFTAIFLAARRIWYDSTLLVALENLLIFVPFILVSQVALISTRAVWVVCGVTAVIAMLRFAGLKRYFRELNLPTGSLALGLILLAVNIGLLATYRIVGETKMGWMPDSGRDFVINQFTWLAILPAALALANFLPHARETGSLEPQRRWLPAGFFSLWIIATGMHLYCLNYVYNFAFRLEMIVPALWMLGWTAYRRAPEFLGVEPRALRQLLAAASLVTPLIAVSENSTDIFFALTMLNAAIYGAMCLHERDRYFARNLLFASVVMSICGLPEEWMRMLTPNLDRAHYVWAGIAIYLMFYIALSRSPKTGILGSVLVAILVATAFQRHGAAVYWAVQSGLVFLLLHSLRWVDGEHEGARTLRILAASLWVMHTIIWVRGDTAMWMPCIPGGIVLGAYLITQLLRGRWDLFILPAASILTVLSGPGYAFILFLERAPAGLLAVIGSFLLFAFGTAAALTKHRWHRSDGTSA